MKQIIRETIFVLFYILLFIPFILEAIFYRVFKNDVEFEDSKIIKLTDFIARKLKLNFL